MTMHRSAYKLNFHVFIYLFVYLFIFYFHGGDTLGQPHSIFGYLLYNLFDPPYTFRKQQPSFISISRMDVAVCEYIYPPTATE